MNQGDGVKQRSKGREKSISNDATPLAINPHRTKTAEDVAWPMASLFPQMSSTTLTAGNFVCKEPLLLSSKKTGQSKKSPLQWLLPCKARSSWCQASPKNTVQLNSLILRTALCHGPEHHRTKLKGFRSWYPNQSELLL